MSELGEHLRELREAKGASIEDVSHFTKINAKYIEALESGDYESLPAEIYVRGFIKSYGEFIGADIDDLIARFEAEKPKPKARGLFSGKPKEPPPYASPIPQEKKGRKTVIPRKIRIGRGTLVFLVILVVVIIAVIKIYSDRNKNSGPPITDVTDVVVEDSGNGLESRLASPLTRESLTQEIRLKLGEINPAWALGRADSLTLSILTRAKTWVLVETDYRRAFKGDINSGDTMVFRAKNAFFLTMGDPAQMHLMINGFDLSEWPERKYPMDLDINRGNVLQLLEGAEQVDLPRPPRPNIIGAPPEESDTNLTPPPIRTRTPGTSISPEDAGSGGLPNVDRPPPEGPQ